MFRTGDVMAPPWGEPFAAAWCVYADWLADQGERRVKDWLAALRYAVALRRRPRMVLVADLLAAVEPRPGEVEHYPIPSVDNTVAFPPGAGQSRRWCGEYWTNHRWWAYRYAARMLACWFGTQPARGAEWLREEDLLATPADFPGMLDEHPEGKHNSRHHAVLIAFYQASARCVGRLYLDRGQVWERQSGVGEYEMVLNLAKEFEANP